MCLYICIYLSKQRTGRTIIVRTVRILYTRGREHMHEGLSGTTRRPPSPSEIMIVRAVAVSSAPPMSLVVFSVSTPQPPPPPPTLQPSIIPAAAAATASRRGQALRNNYFILYTLPYTYKNIHTYICTSTFNSVRRWTDYFRFFSFPT